MRNKEKISNDIYNSDDRVDREHFSLFCSCNKCKSKKRRYKIKEKDKCNNLECITAGMPTHHGMDIFIIRYKSDNIDTVEREKECDPDPKEK